MLLLLSEPMLLLLSEPMLLLLSEPMLLLLLHLSRGAGVEGIE